MNVKKTLRKSLALLLAGALLLGGYVPAEKQTSEAATTSTSRKRVSVHDPSIVKEGNTYYIFGSHMAWAKSTDLENWTTFTNNINKDYKTLFAENFSWSSNGDSGYDPSGNMWAPDVIWNKDLNKWCMYMSINGGSWNSSICMLTADSLSGDWTKVGTVVYSGFDDANYDYKKTDYKQVTGESSLSSRYLANPYSWSGRADTKWNHLYGAHAIDPCVFYDEDGKLWMTYGSWSGGIYIFRLDNKTGFRDNSAEAKANYTDAYMGKLIAGSGGATGEASYVQHIGDYYYLFVSYGGLVANGGYSMRVFRSQNPDGPYTDISGDAATTKGSVNGTIGERLMFYYKWSFWTNAQVAQGHNSAFVDDDGNAYVVYHTRTNNGTEYHSVRVHQLFTTESGYLVAAPFEYTSTDNVKSSGYTTSEIAGDYEVIFHNNTDYESLKYNGAQYITLTEDGKVTGAVSGTWTEKNGSASVTLTVDGETYEGTFVEQTLEQKGGQALCFTVVGRTNETCFWGFKESAASTSATATPTPDSGTYYSQNYESSSSATSLWSITGTATINKDSADTVNSTKYVTITPIGSGNRGAVSGFDLSKEPTGKYDIETDVQISSSTGNNGSTTPKTVVAFTCEDKAYDTDNKNVGLSSGYILKLEAEGLSNQIFTINDVASDTVTIPSTDWVHIKVSVDTSDLTKAVLTITNLKTKKTLVNEKEIAVNGEGKLDGMYLLLGRGTGSQAKVDNTTVKAYKEPAAEPTATVPAATAPAATEPTATTPAVTDTVPSATQSPDTGTSVQKSNTTPKKITGLKVTSPKKKKIVVQWNKKSGAANCEIQVSTKKTFSSSQYFRTKTKKGKFQIGKAVRGKTYYVRIRSYVKTNGKTYTSKWSAKKKIRVK